MESLAKQVEHKTWYKIWEINYRSHIAKDYVSFCQLQTLFNKSTATYEWFARFIFRNSPNRYTLQHGLHLN